MANIRWDGPGSISFTSNDSVMEEVELGTSYEYDLDFMKNLSKYEGRFDIEIEQDYLGKDLNKYHDLVPLKKLSNNLGCGLNYEIHIPDELKGRKTTISPIMDDFIETPIVKMIKEEVMKNIPTWNLGDKVIYVGDKYFTPHNKHGVITAIYTKVNLETNERKIYYNFSWLEGGASGDYWRTNEVSYCEGIDFIPDMPVVPYMNFSSSKYIADYVASDINATFTFMSNLHICNMEISKVIFNPPATIVFWKDGGKTIVKCGEGDVFDQEKGLAMAICKRLFGSNKSGSDYYDGFNEIFDAMKTNDPEKAIAMKLIEKKKGKKYFKDICKKYCNEPKPVKEEPKKDNNPCNGCPDRKKGCLTNCEKMQEFVNDIQDTKEAPEPIEPGYFIKHAEERKNKPKAHVSVPATEEKDLGVTPVPMSITNFVEKFDAAMFPSNFLAFCKKNNLYFFVVDKLKGGMKAIDPYTTNWQQVTRYLKSGVMESCRKMKSHDINSSFLAVDMDRTLFAKLPVELRGENRKEKDLYDESGKD